MAAWGPRCPPAWRLLPVWEWIDGGWSASTGRMPGRFFRLPARTCRWDARWDVILPCLPTAPSPEVTRALYRTAVRSWSLTKVPPMALSSTVCVFPRRCRRHWRPETSFNLDRVDLNLNENE